LGVQNKSFGVSCSRPDLFKIVIEFDDDDDDDDYDYDDLSSKPSLTVLFL
jgi:hypothetical protein